MHRSLSMLDLPFVIDGREVGVQGSFGIALHPDDSSDARELFRHADLAAYASAGSASRSRQPKLMDRYSPLI